MAAKQLSQSDLAATVWGRRDAMISGATVSVARNRERIGIYLRGEGLPREHHLIRIAEALGLAPEDLVPDRPTGPRLPPAVSMTMLQGHAARLTVDTVIPADLALRISQLIERAQRNEGAP